MKYSRFVVFVIIINIVINKDIISVWCLNIDTIGGLIITIRHNKYSNIFSFFFDALIQH